MCTNIITPQPQIKALLESCCCSPLLLGFPRVLSTYLNFTLDTSNHSRKASMERRYNLARQHSGVWMSLRDGDFEEEEIWAVLKDRTDNSGVLGKSKEYSTVPVPRSLPSAARIIPKASSNNSGTENFSHEDKIVQQSAPVNIPEWSNVQKNNPRKSLNNVDEFDSDIDFVHEDYHPWCGYRVAGYGGDTDEEDYNYKLPPHEFVARRIAKSQISSSVFEGVGRTLKGRDLSKVRNSILTKTGFLESL